MSRLLDRETYRMAQSTLGASAVALWKSMQASVLKLWREDGKRLRALPHSGRWIVWPFLIMVVVGMQRSVELVSKAVGDVFVTQALYPAKSFFWVVAVVYAIWALRRVVIALGRDA